MSSSDQVHEPSKVNANINTTIGSAKETIGNLTGYQSLEQAGKDQKDQGNAEYAAAQAQGYVEGTADRIGGKIDNVIGAVTGDTQRELEGKAREQKGAAQQEINKP